MQSMELNAPSLHFVILLPLHLVDLEVDNVNTCRRPTAVIQIWFKPARSAIEKINNMLFLW
jgi:hypothetical protein